MKDYKAILKKLMEDGFDVVKLLIADVILCEKGNISNENLEEQTNYIYEMWIDNATMSIEEAIDKCVYGIEV